MDIGSEREYFGLMFNDTGADNVPAGHAPDVMRWLDKSKLIRKQVRINIPGHKSGTLPMVTLYFRVKFYVTGWFKSLSILISYPGAMRRAL